MTEPILLVEDDNADALLIERALGKVKITNGVHRVDNGDAAIEYLTLAIKGDTPTPVLVLLDLKLPRRSGFEVLQWLRNHDAPLRRVPVVVLTSSSQDADINRAYDAGANSYLVKPGSPEDLLRVLGNIQSYWLALNMSPELNTQA